MMKILTVGKPTKLTVMWLENVVLPMIVTAGLELFVVVEPPKGFGELIGYGCGIAAW